MIVLEIPDNGEFRLELDCVWQHYKAFINNSIKKLSVIIILVLMAGCLVSCNNPEKLNLDQDSNELNRNSYDNIDKYNVDTSIDDNEILNDMIEKGFEIIPEHSFWIELDNYGKVKFISGTCMNNYPILNLYFYIVDSDNKVLFEFSDFFANMWIFYEIKDITFQDVNSDGKTDVIVTAYYMVSAGEKSGMPFSVATIFYQNDMEFITLPDIDKNMHELEQNENIEMVLKYAEEHMEDILMEINKINE